MGTVGRCIVGEGRCIGFGWCDACTRWLCRRTALHHALEKGFVELVKALVESSADVHGKDYQGYGRPLHRGRSALAFDSDCAMGAHVGRAGGRRCTMPQRRALWSW
jgi:hypothetical protein